MDSGQSFLLGLTAKPYLWYNKVDWINGSMQVKVYNTRVAEGNMPAPCWYGGLGVTLHYIHGYKILSFLIGIWCLQVKWD